MHGAAPSTSAGFLDDVHVHVHFDFDFDFDFDFHFHLDDVHDRAATAARLGAGHPGGTR